MTAADVISGTPAFMAPEMITGGDEEVGPSADVYALGCVAYWLLTGKFVFDAPNATAMLLRHLQTPPPAPSASAPYAIPAEIDQLILDCLAKDPAARPANAVELGRRLDSCVAASAWSDETAHAWWAEHKTDVLEPDAKTADNGEQVPATLTA